MIPENEPAIRRDDGTPKLSEQCRENEWQFGFYDFGKGEADNRTFFNPTIVEREDGLWLLARVAEITNPGVGNNSIYAFQLGDEGKKPLVGYRLRWPDSSGDEQHEDPRAVFFPSLNQTAICCTNFKWYGPGYSPSWSGATQVLGFFDEQWQCKVKHRPPIGGNPPSLVNIEPKQYEKSWCPFFHENELHIMYAPNPWRIIRFGETWSEFNGYEYKQGISWKYGTIRNGTPPVLVDGEYISFFHSSLHWKGNYRRYYMGAVAFDWQPPFHPTRLTYEPLLAGSQNDPWQLRKPPCIFPGGAIYKNDKWLIVAGVNDLKSCWIEMDHASILERLKPITGSVVPIIPPSGLSVQEIRRFKLRQNLEKARAAWAQKRKESVNEEEKNGQRKRKIKRRKRRVLKSLAQ